MSSIIETVEVAVPVRTAYDQWTQFEEFPQFMEGVEEIRQTDATHNHWKITIAGVKREFDAEVTEQHPDERIAWKSVDGAGHAGVVTFHRLDDTHTRVTLQLDTAPEGIVETLGDKLGLVSHRAKADMGRFKEYIESRGGESGAWRGDVARPDERGGSSSAPAGSEFAATPEGGYGSDPGRVGESTTPAYGTSAGLAASSVAGTTAGSGYPLMGDPYTESDTYSTAGTAETPAPESARDLASEGTGTGRHTATSQDSDPFAGIGSTSDGLDGRESGYATDRPDSTVDLTTDPGHGSSTPESSSYDVDGIRDETLDDDGAPIVNGESVRSRDPRVNPR